MKERTRSKRETHLRLFSHEQQTSHHLRVRRMEWRRRKNALVGRRQAWLAPRSMRSQYWIRWHRHHCVVIEESNRVRIPIISPHQIDTSIALCLPRTRKRKWPIWTYSSLRRGRRISACGRGLRQERTKTKHFQKDRKLRSFETDTWTRADFTRARRRKRHTLRRSRINPNGWRNEERSLQNGPWQHLTGQPAGWLILCSLEGNIENHWEEKTSR